MSPSAMEIGKCDFFTKRDFSEIRKNASLAGMPETLIIGAEIDPLPSEGKLLSDKLKAANVKTDYRLYNGVTYKFFGMAAVVLQAKDAQALAASKLKSAFGK